MDSDENPVWTQPEQDPATARDHAHLYGPLADYVYDRLPQVLQHFQAVLRTTTPDREQ